MSKRRWKAVAYGFGFQKLGEPSSDTLANMMDDYESEIDRLTIANKLLCEGAEAENQRALKAETELKRVRESLHEERDARHEYFLEWRGIYSDDGCKPCKDCSGSGYKMYGTTSTWYSGLGGQQITSGICDKCWGSGDINNPWSNLRKLWNLKNEDKKQLEQYKAEIDRLTAELSRYRQGVEVEGYLDFSEILQQSVIFIDDQTYPADLLDQRVRVLMMPKEDGIV